MNVIIIEDEKPAARRLQRMLQQLNIHVSVMLHSVQESIDWFLNNAHPDLILLDIQLSDGLSFEIFNEVCVSSSIIFTTAYDAYALKAFKLNSIDYLLKPIDDEELNYAIQQFKEVNAKQIKPNFDIESIQKLLQNPMEKDYKKRFIIKINQRLKIINVSDIVCFYSEDKATFIQTSDTRTYCIDYTLEQLENLLDPKIYYRVNRKCFVQITAIKDIISYANSRLQIKIENFTAFDIIVSREKVKNFKNWLG